MSAAVDHRPKRKNRDHGVESWPVSGTVKQAGDVGVGEDFAEI